MSGTVRWFEEEQRLFHKNKELIRKALQSCENDMGYYEAMGEIHLLENELNKAMNKHSQLLEACMALQSQTDEMIAASKLNRIKMAFDFRKMLTDMMKKDDISGLEFFVRPLLKPAVRKCFSLTMIDNLLSFKGDMGEIAEKESEAKYDENYRYPDELEEQRISDNYALLMESLLAFASQRKQFDLKEFNDSLRSRLGTKVFESADYYSFIVHLCQKKDYDLAQTIRKPDTFLEEMLRDLSKRSETFVKKFGVMQLTLQFTDEKIMLGNHEIENIIFENKLYGNEEV